MWVCSTKGVFSAGAVVCVILAVTTALAVPPDPKSKIRERAIGGKMVVCDYISA